MTEEALQAVEETDITAPADNSQTQTVNPEGADQAPAQQEDPVKFDERQQSKVDEIVGGKVKAQRDAERERDALRAELEAAHAKMPQETRPDVPEVPDPFDDDFETKVKERDQAITRAAAFDANATLLEQQQQQQLQNQQQQQIVELQQKADTYKTRAAEFGLKQEDLQQAAQNVATSLNPQLVGYLLDDADGPLITQYLGNNVLALEKVRNMPVLQAATHIATVVRAEAQATRKPSQAPRPADVLSGNGQLPAKRGSAGYSFD